MQVLGIDIGGSGIKGALIDTQTGEMLTDRHRIPTPLPGTPEQVGEIVGAMARQFDWTGPVGCGFPAPLRHGEVLYISNLDAGWRGRNADALFSEMSGCDVHVINDADAAGLAELHFGAARGRKGVVLMLTLGTGIGSALFVDGVLVPNTEFGHVEFDGMEAEWYAADAARKREELSWKKWARRLDRTLHHFEFLLRPELIVLGGGVSKKAGKFIPRLTVTAEVVPAEMRNRAGIIGAGLAMRLV